MIRILLFVLLALPAHAGSVLVSVEGMDCAGCNKKLSDAVVGLPFVSKAKASFAEQAVCGDLSGDLDEPALRAAVATTTYAVLKVTPLDACPETLNAPLPTPWGARSAGLDVQTVSHGEEFDLKAALVPGKYTIVDFGASWCGPCHEAAEALAKWMADDVAVRAIELAGDDPEKSYAQPVVAQHLQYVQGIPWFIAYAPNGKVLKKGQSVDAVMKAIDAHRKRSAK